MFSPEIRYPGDPEYQGCDRTGLGESNLGGTRSQQQRDRRAGVVNKLALEVQCESSAVGRGDTQPCCSRCRTPVHDPHYRRLQPRAFEKGLAPLSILCFGPSPGSTAIKGPVLDAWRTYWQV